MKPKQGYCINCDNRHGCKTKTPPCIDEMTEKDIAGMSGKPYMMETSQTDKCRDCPFFRSCWKSGEYGRLGK